MKKIDEIKLEINQLYDTKKKLDFDLKRLKNVKELQKEEKDIDTKKLLLELQVTLEELIKYEGILYKRISKLENIYVRSVMELRYIQGHKWEDIVERMGFSREWIFELHRRGLKELKSNV